MKLLVSGCSYTENASWPKILFGDRVGEILNPAKAGAGNNYISNSVTYHAPAFQPDFVYILWSGINRIELRTSNTNLFRSYGAIARYRQVELGNSIYYLSGHALDPEYGWLAAYNIIKDKSWPEINNLQQWFDLPEKIKKECLNHKIYLSSYGGKENSAAFCNQYFLMQNLVEDRLYQSELTFQNIVNCCNLLEKLRVPYRFSFIYDIWNKNEFRAHGRAMKEFYYSQIDWTKFIDLPPYNFGVKHDLLGEDDYHLTDEGMTLWAGEIQKILQADPALTNLFK